MKSQRKRPRSQSPFLEAQQIDCRGVLLSEKDVGMPLCQDAEARYLGLLILALWYNIPLVNVRVQLQDNLVLHGIKKQHMELAKTKIGKVWGRNDVYWGSSSFLLFRKDMPHMLLEHSALEPVYYRDFGKTWMGAQGMWLDGARASQSLKYSEPRRLRMLYEWALRRYGVCAGEWSTLFEHVVSDLEKKQMISMYGEK